MLKKIIATLSVLICLATFNVYAMSVNMDFYIYGKDTDHLCEILGMDETQIDDYCKDNSITYLAVDKDNARQIRKTETADKFSKEILDLSLLSDENIKQLASQLSGFENASGDVVEYNDLKLLKTEHETEDSGGKYVLTQYVTVRNAQKEVLTFYTAAGTDRGYIDIVLKEQFKAATNYLPFIIAGVIIFAALAIMLLWLILKDLKKDKT